MDPHPHYCYSWSCVAGSALLASADHTTDGGTHPGCPLLQATVVFKEGVTALLGGATLPSGGLCGRTIRVQFAAKNGAGYSGVVTTTATFTMPACSSEMGKSRQANVWYSHLHASACSFTTV